jgi:two-component system OmpR family response regulator
MDSGPGRQFSEETGLAKKKTRVLVVDDDATMRDVLELRLRKWGYDVILASDARDAADILDRSDPDLILSDVVMPELSGLDLLRSLRSSDPDRPVISTTVDEFGFF